MDGKKPLFSADAAEEYFSTLLTYYRNTGNNIFKQDNEGRHVSDQIYSAEYQKYLGMQIAMREVLEYFAKFELGDTALRQQDVTDKDVGKWISVKDRLPDYMGEVLVIVSGKPHENITLDGAYEIAEYDPVEGWILEMWPEWCSGVVTHWMPLPEPPEEDEAK